MTLGAALNKKQKVSLGIACLSLIAAVCCFFVYRSTGTSLFMATTILAAMLAVVCGVGVWASGLTPSNSSEDEDWSTAIR